jgi:excinuclease ABC subunit A
MTESPIRIRNARQNNLAGVDVEIPKQRLVAITGVSGSGKSSLAFDTLFREGQRRFLETLSAYARQFLGGLEKPDVESIEGLSPAIAVDQKSIQRGARSTVGTLTEIVDHLRVIYARAGKPHCPACRLPVGGQTPEEIAQAILREHANQTVLLLAPIVRDKKGHHSELLEDLRKRGFVRARVDGRLARIEDLPELARYVRHTIEAVIDRLEVREEKLARLRESLDAALRLGEGDLIVVHDDGERRYSTSRACPGCGRELPPLEPRLFSFNSPHGACPDCEGLGELRTPSAAAVLQDPRRSLREGALRVTRASGNGLSFPSCDFEFLATVAEASGFDLDTPWNKLPRAAQRVILHGTGEERYETESSWSGKKFSGTVRWNKRFVGVLPAIERAWREGKHKAQIEALLSAQTCSSCSGSRLRPESAAVTFGGVSLPELGRLSIAELGQRLGALELEPREARIARDLLTEIRRRIEFLHEVGLDYLTLERSADTLSGGEAQRIRLAAQLGAGLSGVMYVLDEPSIGLHARDHARLIRALERLRDGGNSVIVVEHDESTLRAADWLIDVGPGAGAHGGRIVASGPPEEVARGDGATARLLRGEFVLKPSGARRTGNGHSLVVRGARAFHLQNLDVRFPLGMFLAVTGVSGSGKSTLVQRILERALLRKLGREGPPPEAHDAIDGLEHIDDLVAIDSAPIGRTPRSNPATYTGVFDPIRDLFAALPEAKLRAYDKSRFSFNVAGGRCEVCSGAGAKLVELQFLSPVTVPCEECGGRRFNLETLDVRYAEKTIADVLAMTAEEALALFRDFPKIARPLELMCEVGLGYLRLGQPSTTISGGEAQRIKLVTELQKRPRGHTLYILDEPTTGLHMQDVARLVASLEKLVDLGHTVLVIEHNLDLVLAADHVIDLGPEGGAGGGRLIAEGTPERIVRVAQSATGRALGEFQNSRHWKPRAASQARDRARPEAPRAIRVRGARTHNLKGVDVDIPRESLVVVSGPSGSGKSSLALDTIYTEGRRRFVESLSTYARQFLGTKDRPPVDRIEGLGPSVAVEAKGLSASPRSTVATTTEILDHLRVLWARAGTRRCPEHGAPLERTDASRVTRAILSDFAQQSVWISAPMLGLPLPAVEEPEKLIRSRLAAWRAAGFARLLIDGRECRLEDPLPTIGAESRVELVIDRVGVAAGARARIAEAVEQAEALSGGRVRVRSKSGLEHEYSSQGACPQCGFSLSGDLEPRHFSFNTHIGACRECDGLGEHLTCTEELLFERPELSIEDGAIHGKLSRWLVRGKGYYEMLLRTVAQQHKVPLDKPWSWVPEDKRALIAHGTAAKSQYKVKLERHTQNAQIEEEFRAAWPGLCGHVDAWHKKTEDPEWAATLETVMERRTCSVCGGERLAPASRAVTIGKQRLPELLGWSVKDSLGWIRALRGKATLERTVGAVMSEIEGRLALLDRVGLGYLTLSRATHTLSGGEARRVRLASSLGSQLTGVCYVLDEPTVGLHPRDTQALVDALRELVNRKNSVIVVEHDPAVMRRADWIVDMGPGAGRNGGEVVACGPVETVMAVEASSTGAALRGELELTRAPRESEAETAPIQLKGARLHTLQGVDLEFRFGQWTGVCGPSGSGKSTLVLDCLVPALRGEKPQGRWKKLTGLRADTRIVVVDAAPLGRTPASIPATYMGLMEPLRELYTRTQEARAAGLDAGAFSFNSPKGRCVACEGKGATRVELQFLADLWLTCEECEGRRYAPHVLAVRWRGRSIAEALELSAEEAREFFAHQPQIAPILDTLCDVGLGYLQLGQSSTTLSGGEAQRVKLAAELFRAQAGGRSIVVLDEPSTGLAQVDVLHLARVLDRLSAAGNAIVMIEHHTGLLAACDQLVELGPGGGEEGGRVIARGTPRELEADRESVTGPWLELPSQGLAWKEALR